MAQRESNNDFFSYQGSISRKNYIINMLILSAIYIGLSFIHFENFSDFIRYKILLTILIFMADLLKFVVLLSALSVIYRRIADFSVYKSYKFNLIMRRVFVFLYVLPVLYIFCIRYFLDIMPFLINILDIIVFFIVLPIAFISSVVFCFIKSN